MPQPPVTAERPDAETAASGATDPAADVARGDARPRDRMARSTVLSLFVVAALLLAGVTVAAVALRPDPAATPASPWRGTTLYRATPRPDFVLTDTDGNRFDFRARTAGRLTLLMFGYANCPDVCPVTMATIGATLRENPVVRPTVVFVSVDPTRDNPASLRAWLDRFDPQFIGLTGTAEEVRAAQDAAAVPLAAVGGAGAAVDGGVTVGHASQVLAYTADDLGHVVYPFGTRQEDWAHDLPLLASDPAWSRR